MRAILGAGAAVAAGWSVPALAPIAPPVAAALAIPTRTRHGVAITFDDGPDPLGTPAVLEALAAAQARATFFLVGEQVRRAPALVAELVAAGHAIAVHGDRHRNLLRLSRRAIDADLDRAAAAIADAGGGLPRLHRAPYGVYSWPALGAARERGWTPVLWSRWGRDWRRSATAASVATLVAEGVRDGDVLLLHDADRYSAPGSWRATAAALPRVLEAIASAGLATVTLSAPSDLAQAGR